MAITKNDTGPSETWVRVLNYLLAAAPFFVLGASISKRWRGWWFLAPLPIGFLLVGGLASDSINLRLWGRGAFVESLGGWVVGNSWGQHFWHELIPQLVIVYVAASWGWVSRILPPRSRTLQSAGSRVG